ncbi:hypothetical protein [Candidatus Villigracilis affinis]|nr:hypothetical protein [Anaerolineales bacterium]
MLWSWTDKDRNDGYFSRPTGLALDGKGMIVIVNQSGGGWEIFKLP